MNTIHKDVSTIFNKLIAGLVLLGCATVSQANSVFLDPALSTVGIGTGTVSLDLKMDFSEDTAGGTTIISFDNLFLDNASWSWASSTVPGVENQVVVINTSSVEVKIARFFAGPIPAGAHTIGTILLDSIASTASTLVSLTNGLAGNAWSGPGGNALVSEPTFSGANVAILGAAVPVPSAVWLFGSGLIGLVGIARRRNNA